MIMDATKPKDAAVADFSKVYGFYLKIENSSFPSTVKQNNTVIKYTKLPNFDFDSKVSWPKNSYTLPPRLRRIISVDDHLKSSSRSLNNDSAPRKFLSSSFNSTRKIVSINEDEENDNVPFKKEIKRSTTMTKASSTEPVTRRNFRSPPSKYAKYNKPSANASTTNAREPSGPSKSNSVFRDKGSNVLSLQNNVIMKTRNMKEKEVVRRSGCSPAVHVNKNTSTQRDSMDFGIVKKASVKTVSNDTYTTENFKSQVRAQSKSLYIDKVYKSKALSSIHVPRTDQIVTQNNVQSTHLLEKPTYKRLNKIDCSTEIDSINISRDVDVATDPAPIKVDKTTEMDKICLEKDHKKEPKESSKLKLNSKLDIKVDVCNEFDSLEIPNVTLVKEKSDYPKEDLVNLHSQSLPNLNLPLLKFKSQYENVNDRKCSSQVIHSTSSTSYIIGSATLTYTTRQKINFHMIDSDDPINSDVSYGPLVYPLNVVSVYKEEIENKKLNEALASTHKEADISTTQNVIEPKCLNLEEAGFGSKEFEKPSDIISTIRVNNELLKSDFICEQFQRELNFIDSFFKSLQYLENCSMTSNNLTNNKVENWVTSSGFDIKNPEYDSFLSKFDNDTGNEDTKTMASKSLCLLNLLIRDEQRRAKNLLYVLKMREDALKDFTKSQILWLENKKKQENIDISTLKKKQRGALLKLQHECGEMQRMRKALLALSEKRKVALMKTKKNIELKLKNNVTVDQIVLGKKKLKRNPATDRAVAPLKCFDLSSSGCDDTTPVRVRSDTILTAPEVTVLCKRAEKSIQTGDSILDSKVTDKGTDTAAENVVVVDGGYLNILFQNFSLPQIFSNGKQYEVNEDALKNIVNATNTNNSLNDSNIVEKFIGQIKFDLDKSANSTPSTARSLVEEFDQYYKGLTEEEKSPTDSMNRDYNDLEYEFDRILLGDTRHENRCFLNTSTITRLQSPESAQSKSITSEVEIAHNSLEISATQIKTESDACSPDVPENQFLCTVTARGPVCLPVDSDKSTTSLTTTGESNFSIQPLSSSAPSLSSVGPVHSEAEELRRQQLAVEREIKALEQQQLLVVREIPDKPPPPYTPPTAETRAQRVARMFLLEDNIEQKIHDHLSGCSLQNTDAVSQLDVFISEYCNEMLDKQKSDQGDKPWDACNLLPQKPQLDLAKLVKKTASDLTEILSGAQPTVVSGVGARRSDHIDDILFAEWRRSEPEWTTLHADEAYVKNQIFESIFQKVLTDTVDEYKKIAPV